MEPAPARSPRPQQDPARPQEPTMPPPETPSEGRQPSPSPSPTERAPASEEEFQFLRCQQCQAEAKCPKLLPCLHTLCSGCLEASGMQCPICQAPWPLGADTPALDNVFFESLQRRLSVYRQIVDAQAVCTRCKESADFWCFECEQLLCAKCFEAHQWFLKHEARPLAELRNQSVREFLDGTRKTNNIFCSNPNHRTPTLTSIYCRGCSKPLCCSCALLDSSHSELKCDISAEIQQRQEELDAMTQALQEQDSAFGAVHAQMHAAVGQLGRARAETEELIRERVRQVVAHVRAQERELLEAVDARYQRDYEEMASRLGRLDAVLQRIRTGSALVQRMKCYASDQEVLDMHGFLRQALCRLRQEEPQSLQAAVRTDGFDEFKVRLQDLSSCITQGKDAAVSKKASPEAASTPRDPIDVDLDVSNTTTAQKRKCSQTQCPRKVIKMESEEGKEARLARSSPEQPRPSTSKAVSPPHLDGPPSPRSPVIGSEVFLPNSNHVASGAGEAEERVVVISSSEDSDAENSCMEPMETAEPQSSPAHSSPAHSSPAHSSPVQSLLRAQGASSLPCGTYHPPAWPPHQPAEQAATPDAEPHSEPPDHQERPAVHRGIRYLLYRAQRAIRLRHALRLHPQLHRAPIRTWSPHVVQASTPAITGPLNHPANAQEHPAQLQRGISPPHRIRGAVRSRSRSLRGSSHLSQWLNNFFALPFSSMASQLDMSSVVGAGESRAQTLGAGVPPGDSVRGSMEASQVQVPLEASPITFPPPCAPERPPISPVPGARQAGL
ncbi:PML nuclear body scaffold [Homo sapiens]|uniref:Isoform PML-13 of Protein PML n=1 Tax=Homo sapiens TaxID=9606 RepID=P29590-13|nr:protein PML isoform 11 [Homo sapiens]KAI4058671.1 PML nuclear body scaffold [Homo sapiens]|eukprot:NP_150253.2 protein PML isoform 11 [Homo sapiens]